jgi:hypothetical protein
MFPATSRMKASRYDDMVLKAYEVHWGYNVAAASFSWLLLAGFIVFPGAFRSLGIPGNGDKVPFICFSGVCCFVGLLGTAWLWRKFRHNYVWLLSHLFEWVMPSGKLRTALTCTVGQAC